ncbi:uncharacterized protein LOC134391917 [Elgaria multicarinata webbii]|uniref:uncharacterized protein LOC134391917 n=1 Tax=Elgaria multicarinata webbii TaxID=159646 RepID=UPI002FCCF5A8
MENQAEATRTIGRIIQSTDDVTALEARFPELLLALVNNIMQAVGLQRTSKGSESQDIGSLPPKETAAIIRMLLKRAAAHVAVDLVCWYILRRPKTCLHGVAVLVRALLAASPSTQQGLQEHLRSLMEREEPTEHSVAAVAFFVELLLNDTCPVSLEKTWPLLAGWLAHPSQAAFQLSRKGLLHLYVSCKRKKRPEDFIQGILGSSDGDATLAALDFAQQLWRHLPEQEQVPLNAPLAAQESAQVRKAALHYYRVLLQHQEPHEERRRKVTDLIGVLMHVEDEDEAMAEAAKDIARRLTEDLQRDLPWHVLARETFSLQELLHKISKRLLRYHTPRCVLESEVYDIMTYFRSKQASVRRTAAMFLGHLMHKDGSVIIECVIDAYHAFVDLLIRNKDPAIRRVGYRTGDILRKNFALHSRHGVRAAVRRFVAGCRRTRYPPEYHDLPA